MARRRRQQRTQVDRAGITALTGASGSTIAHWLRHREQSRFPTKAATDSNGRDWWWLDEIETFWDAHLAARAATFTTVDRTGDPDDLLGAPQAAAVLGYASHRNIPKVLLDQHDHAERLPSGRLRRFWYRRSLWDYADGRPLRHSTGRPPGTRADQRQPHPYAEDPRLDAAITLLREAHPAGRGTRGLGTQLARRLDINPRTAQRLIAAAQTARRTATAAPPPAITGVDVAPTGKGGLGVVRQWGHSPTQGKPGRAQRPRLACTSSRPHGPGGEPLEASWGGP